jgi:site-specific DNA recombinase
MSKQTPCFVGYIRVSTKKQMEGSSLQVQKEAISKYCDIHDLDLVKIYTDKGISAYKKRPQFQAMIEHVLKDNTWNGVIVYDLTRFGRSTTDLLFQINRLDGHGKKFVSVKDNIDIGTKTGRLLLTMLSAIADFERETIRERMDAGKEYARVHGTKSGKPMHRPYAEIDWDQVKELRGYGLSWRKTAKQVRVSPATLIKRAREEKYYDE